MRRNIRGVSATRPAGSRFQILLFTAAIAALAIDRAPLARSAARQQDSALAAIEPYVQSACAPLREKPMALWPHSLPYGPLTLEARKATPEDAARLRELHQALVASACGLSMERVKDPSGCEPDCVQEWRTGIEKNAKAVDALAAEFGYWKSVHLIAYFGPSGEFRVNDVFVLGGEVREALPVTDAGLVPSGNWKTWPTIESAIGRFGVPPSRLVSFPERLHSLGLIAIVREANGLRLVGGGSGNVERGLLRLRPGTAPPKIDSRREDGRVYSLLVRQKDLLNTWYYETR